MEVTQEKQQSMFYVSREKKWDCDSQMKYTNQTALMEVSKPWGSDFTLRTGEHGEKKDRKLERNMKERTCTQQVKTWRYRENNNA